MSVKYKITFIFVLSAILPFIVIGSLVYIDFQNIAGRQAAEILGYQLVFFITILVLFVALIGSWMSQSVIRPVVNLSRVTAKLRKGDFSARADVQSRDEIGQLAEDFNAMAAGLEAIDNTKTELTVMISHQLRTPATAIKGFVSMLLDGYAGKLQPHQTELLKGALEECGKQEKLISQILDLTRIDAASLKMTITPVDLGKLCKKVVAEHLPQANARKQLIKLTIPDTEITANGDESKLQIAVDNLLANALKYSPNKTTVEVAVEDRPDAAIISVSDEGYGINVKDQPKIFNMFTRLRNPRSTTETGSGLGLYMVKRIVKLHKGEVSLVSNLREGSTFTISLPKGER